MTGTRSTERASGTSRAWIPCSNGASSPPAAAYLPGSSVDTGFGHPPRSVLLGRRRRRRDPATSEMSRSDFCWPVGWQDGPDLRPATRSFIGHLAVPFLQAFQRGSDEQKRIPSEYPSDTSTPKSEPHMRHFWHQREKPRRSCRLAAFGWTGCWWEPSVVGPICRGAAGRQPSSVCRYCPDPAGVLRRSPLAPFRRAGSARWPQKW